MLNLGTVDFLPLTDNLFGIQENKEGLELLKSAIAKAGYTGKVSVPAYIEILLMVLWLFKRLHLMDLFDYVLCS